MTDTITLPIFLDRTLNPAKDTNLPKYGSADAAGFDFAANIAEPIVIAPGETKGVKTGVYLSLPRGYELQVRPRSGLALKHSITCLNSPGTIDADYRGEVMVILINHGKADFRVEHGDRIAQGVIARCWQAKFVEVSQAELGETARGSGGFGSTGTKS